MTILLVQMMAAIGDHEYQVALGALASVIIFLAAVIRALYNVGQKCQEEKAQALERHERILTKMLKDIREERDE